MKRTIGTAVLAALLVWGLQSAQTWANTVVIPRVFSPGQALPLAWLNDNFAAIQAVVNALDGGNIVDGSLTGVDLAAGTITTAKLANGSVTTAALADAPNGVSGPKLNAGVVTDTHVAAAAAIDGGKLRTASVTKTQLAAGAAARQVVTDTPTVSIYTSATAGEQDVGISLTLSNVAGKAVLLGGALGMALDGVPGVLSTVQFRWYRGGSLVGTTVAWVNGTDGPTVPVATPSVVDTAPGSGTVIYTLKVVVTATSGIAGLIVDGTVPGSAFAMELS